MTAAPPLELEPGLAEAEPPAEITVKPAPTLKGFADLLVARLANRVLLVRKAPTGEGILVVVDRDPAVLRPDLEGWLQDYFAPASPALHLMEPEGYQALSAFWPSAPAVPSDEPFRAAALPSPAGASGREEQRRRLKKASAGFDFAAKRLAFAEVALKGGFPEEMLRPLGEALGWALNALLAACGQDREPSADLPSARLVQAALTEPGHLSADLAAKLARVRELTAPAAEGESAPPPSLKAGEMLGAAVRELIELGRDRIVAEGL